MPLIVVFCVLSNFPQVNARHYYFTLEGLAEVETNLIVPPEMVSPKEEYSARTFRPRILNQLKKFLKKVPQSKYVKSSLGLGFKSIDISNSETVIRKLKIDRSVGKTEFFKGGTSETRKLLRVFINEKLTGYGESSSYPSKGGLSNMSPYLHFGQISPVYIALEILKHGGAGAKVYLEELIVRRELAHNFIYYNPDYDKLKSTANWTRRTLNVHGRDKRPYIYLLEQLENAQTHDKYWNAAQKEMVITGKMHGYMRMYWGKKILEWSKTPEIAFKTAIYPPSQKATGVCYSPLVPWGHLTAESQGQRHKIFGKTRGLRSRRQISSTTRRRGHLRAFGACGLAHGLFA
jgi:deoxyribodipyrimidine photo-lyase